MGRAVPQDQAGTPQGQEEGTGDADCSENGFNTRGRGYQDEGEGCENAGTSTIRKQELKISEELVQEKDGAKQELDKKIESSMRRQSFVEKKILEKVMFEKPRKKK